MAAERTPSTEQTLAAAVGLQTIAIEALVNELRTAREKHVHGLWHTAIIAVTAIAMFSGLRLLLPERPITVTSVAPVGMVTR